MKICFSSQMKSLDETSIKEYGIPGIVLMENAGLSVVEEIEKLNMPVKRAEILCGTGNNGGDGFVVARHLSNKGWKVSVAVCGAADKLKGDALTNYGIVKKMGIPMYAIDETSIGFLDGLLKDSTLVVDALLGTGFCGPLKDFFRNIINKVNESEACVVSVDVPSGLNADTGFLDDVCVMADCTVTFQLPKVGLLINEGPGACGRLEVKDISIPKAAIGSAQLTMNLLEREMIRGMLPRRGLNTHKGSFGNVFAAACSKGMEGSGMMASVAALKSGAGTVLLGMPESLQEPISCSALEIMTAGLPDKGMGVLSEECIPKLMELAERSSVLLIGPGLTHSNSISDIMQAVIQNCDVPIVIDADGLNAIADNPALLKGRRCDIAITPHPGEMARLCGAGSKDIQRDRLGYAARFAAECGVIVVLKGYRTLIALPDGNIFVNPTGNPGMATAGSGDVLAGIIAGFAAQGLELSKAALCGVYVHGAAGDRAAELIGEFGLTAGDIIANIPHTIKNITGK